MKRASDSTASKEDIEAVVDLPILYVDEHIVVINKPFGLNTIPGNELIQAQSDNEGGHQNNSTTKKDEQLVSRKAAEAGAEGASLSTAPSSSSAKKRTHQELWVDMIRGQKDNPPTWHNSLNEAQAHLKPYITALVERHDSIPRKRPKFIGWGVRTLKAPEAAVEEIYEVLKANFEATEGTRVDSVMTRLLKYFPEVKTVHRLDCETSGACVVALTVAAARALSQQFKDKVVKKQYVAVVEGASLPVANGEINLAIRPEYEIRPKQLIDPEGGKDSRTIYRTLAADSERKRTKVELLPLTGRTHQLRLHMAALGTPIVGDSIYSIDDKWTRGEVEIDTRCCVPSFVTPLPAGEEKDEEGIDDGREKTVIEIKESRLHLHAELLSIDHPVTGKRMTFLAKAPF